ncbi:hypothetical protein BDY24DRAFT_425366 [Mrakia frigida]|uniref:uncharacterized protein n=1 Tax=Mrakia frigida TaxID=29902 RepID=UPI003FCC0A1C
MTMFSKFTGGSTQQQPAPLPPNPHSQQPQEHDHPSPRQSREFMFPSNSNNNSDENAPPSPSPSRVNNNMPPPPLPSKTTRIPRLSLVPASRDQWQAHRNKLSMGGSSSSLKEMMEKNGSRTVTTEIRVECLERRVRNSKEDAVGLAKDILSLCEEAANVKQWYNSLNDKTDSIINELTEYRDENQQLRSNAASQKLRNEELSSTVSKLAKQLNNQADAFRELHAQVADQDRKLNDLLASPRDESFMTSATSLSNSTITGPTADLAAIFARLETLETASAATPARAAVPSTPAQVAEEKAKLRRAQEDHDREERRARQREVEAREREDKIQSLLGEALQRNITLAARVRELEATAKANSLSSSSSTHSHHSSNASSNSSLLNSSVASINVNSGAQTPSAQQQHHQKDRKAQLAGGAPAPSIPALDPFSPFVVRPLSSRFSSSFLCASWLTSPFFLAFRSLHRSTRVLLRR